MARPLKVAQFRLTGIHEGTRVLIDLRGQQHRWRLDCFSIVEERAMKKGREVIKLAKHSRIITTKEPCLMEDLHAIYDTVVAELCQKYPEVRGGGWDAFLIPKAAT